MKLTHKLTCVRERVVVWSTLPFGTGDIEFDDVQSLIGFG